MESWLQDNDIEMYSTHYEEKSVDARRFIGTLKNKIYKYMTTISKNVYIDKLDDIVNISSDKYHSIIKMKPIDLKYGTYLDVGKENNEKYPKLEFGDHVRISKYNNIFARCYAPNWSDEVFMIKTLKMPFHEFM